jgi:cell division protein FtsB
MRKRVRLVTVLIIAITMVVCALLVIDNLNDEISGLQKDLKQAEVDLRKAEHEVGNAKAEIENMNKSSYVISRARELGFLMPGEIRFVVVNPEVLMDSPEDVIVEELPQE